MASQVSNGTSNNILGIFTWILGVTLKGVVNIRGIEKLSEKRNESLIKIRIKISKKSDG